MDRTALIRDLEKTSYALFLRPRRFGKSLLCSILQSYYDIDYADRFDELFGGLDIGRDPSDERGKYLVLNFNFSGVEKQADRVQASFNFYASLRLDKFARDYAARRSPASRTATSARCSRTTEPELVDRNLRTDYMKIRHVITEGRKVNGNYHRLEDVIARLGATATLKDSFQARELGEPDSFVSFLFYNGLVTVAGERMGRTRLAVPNLTVGEFMHDFVPRAYADVYGIDARLYDVADGMADFAETGDWRKALVSACEVVSRYWRVRDAAEGERVVQTALCSLLYVGHGPYLVRHEQESAGGFVDIAFEPQLARWPQIGHAALVELKYLKLSDDASPAALAKLKADAAAQLDRYAKDRDLARAWNLKEQGGTVTLHRIAVVFHGGDVALCEEI